MILLLLSVYLVYKVLLRKDHFFLAYFLILLFAIKSFPSEIAEYFVLHVGSNMIKFEDIFLLITIAYLFTNRRAQMHIYKHWKITSIVLLVISFNLLQLLYSWVDYGMESHYLRVELFGTLCLILCIVRFELLQNQASRKMFGIVLNTFNIVTLITAFLIVNYPHLNQVDSKLYSAIGWHVESGSGSMVYITVIAADVCLFSIYYFLFLQKHTITHPSVILPMVLVVMSSHRITYLALLTLLIFWVYNGVKRGYQINLSRFVVVKLLMAFSFLAMVFAVLSQNDYFISTAVLFFERLLSLGDSKNTTIVDRLTQYTYFFTGYLPNVNFSTLLLGENYLPDSMRDDFYLFVNPHNFVIGTIVARGLIGFGLVMLLMFYVLIKSGRLAHNLFFIPLVIFMLTQMTDAAFSNYPFSALYALLLSLMFSNRREKVSNNLGFNVTPRKTLISK